jgi:hypothetical protein
MSIQNLFEPLWSGYRELAPSAPRIHALLWERGEEIENDHIALRSFDVGGLGVDALAAPFEALGYRTSGHYRFTAKKLRARSLSLAGHPRVFISELCTQELPPLVGQVAAELTRQARGLTAQEILEGAPAWAPVDQETWRALSATSEYAAWLSVFGLRANHFTVSVNALRSFGQAPLRGLNAWLQAQGLALNASGGLIKGSPQVMLEQSSTLADQVQVEFGDGSQAQIPGCYVEFALRHLDPETGQLFDGFVTQSADRIFESTDLRG